MSAICFARFQFTSARKGVIIYVHNCTRELLWNVKRYINEEVGAVPGKAASTLMVRELVRARVGIFEPYNLMEVATLQVR